MDSYHPETVYSSIDRMGRYAYGNQPRIAHWNLVRLAQALLPLLGDSEGAAVKEAQEAVDAFPAQFEASWLAGIRRKLGLTEVQEGDFALAQCLLDCMAESQADFTLTFRRLCDTVSAEEGADDQVGNLIDEPAAFDDWAVQWRRRLSDEPAHDPERRADMRAVNPAFVPRNQLVEEAINAALSEDLNPFNELMMVLAAPFADQPIFARYANPPRSDQVVRQTFCGT